MKFKFHIRSDQGTSFDIEASHSDLDMDADAIKHLKGGLRIILDKCMFDAIPDPGPEPPDESSEHTE